MTMCAATTDKVAALRDLGRRGYSGENDLGGLLKGPLPLLLVIGIAWFGYKYLPLDQWVSGFSGDKPLDGPVPQAPASRMTPSTGVSVPAAAVPRDATPVPASAGVASQPAATTPAVARAPVSSPPPAAAVPVELQVLVEVASNDTEPGDPVAPQQYATLLRDVLLAAVRERLGDDSVGDGMNGRFKADLAEGRVGVERLCDRVGSRRLLLAGFARSASRSPAVDKANTPGVTFVAINCADGRLHRSPKRRLQAHRLDGFEYQVDFTQKAQKFIASQAYFLRP